MSKVCADPACKGVFCFQRYSDERAHEVWRDAYVMRATHSPSDHDQYQGFVELTDRIITHCPRCGYPGPAGEHKH
jgi:hypothetical protein